jgi:hypothetical protein
MVSLIIPPFSSTSGLGATEDIKVGSKVVDVSKFQSFLGCGLSLQHPSEFSLQMGDLEAEV